MRCGVLSWGAAFQLALACDLAARHESAHQVPARTGARRRRGQRLDTRYDGPQLHVWCNPAGGRRAPNTLHQSSDVGDNDGTEETAEASPDRARACPCRADAHQQGVPAVAPSTKTERLNQEIRRSQWQIRTRPLDLASTARRRSPKQSCLSM